MKLFENVEFDELKYFVETTLSYLIDAGFELTIQPLTGYYIINLKGDSDWVSIKDDYLFFVDILSNEYQLIGRKPFTIKEDYYSSDYSLDELKEYKGDSCYNNIKALKVFVSPKRKATDL